MPDRDTGLTVTLPLVWRGDYLTLGGADTVKIGRASETFAGDWAAVTDTLNRRFPTRAEAEQAVEAAVMAALGRKG